MRTVPVALFRHVGSMCSQADSTRTRTDSPLERKLLQLARIESVTKRLGQRLVLDQVDLELSAGDILALLGPNGAGKTTLVHILLGLLEPDAGTVTLFGHRCSPPFPSVTLSRIGAVLEHPGIYDRLTLLQNLRFFARIYGVPEPDTRIASLLDAAGLWDRRHDRAHKLSRGQRQRVAIVRALLHQPQVLVLDEPTVGLDAKASDQVMALMAEQAACHDTGILIVSPKLRAVEHTATRAAVLDKGRILAVGAMSDVAKAARAAAAHCENALESAYRLIETTGDSA